MGGDIVIFSGASCPGCIEVKRYFDELEIEYTVRDIYEDESAMGYLTQRGLRGIPQIFRYGVKIGDGTDYRNIS